MLVGVGIHVCHAHDVPVPDCNFAGVTDPSVIATVVTVSDGSTAPFRKSDRVIFLVIAPVVSTIARGKASLGTVKAGRSVIFGMAVSSHSYLYTLII